MQNNQFNTQPVQQVSMQVNNQYAAPFSVGKWIGIFLLQTLGSALFGLGPIIAIIICMTSDNASARNYGKAQLIILIIGVVLSIIGTIIIFALGGLAALSY